MQFLSGVPAVLLLYCHVICTCFDGLNDDERTLKV